MDGLGATLNPSQAVSSLIHRPASAVDGNEGPGIS
jgi:hypothetical protein